MAKKKTKTKLHGAALAAHQKKMGHGGHHKGGHKGGHHGATGHAAGRRPRRRNPRVTFVQAVGKVIGGAAAMFGSGVLVTLGASKLSEMGYPNAGLYGVPVAAALVGAGIATRAPIVGAGVAAGGAAPFVLPVASRILSPAPASASSSPAAAPATVSALRAVAMGSPWRALNSYPRNMSAVSMGAVQMGARRSLRAT